MSSEDTHQLPELAPSQSISLEESFNITNTRGGEFRLLFHNCTVIMNVYYGDKK